VGLPSISSTLKSASARHRSKVILQSQFSTLKITIPEPHRNNSQKKSDKQATQAFGQKLSSYLRVKVMAPASDITVFKDVPTLLHQ
jgi:hypothetical protein